MNGYLIKEVIPSMSCTFIMVYLPIVVGTIFKVNEHNIHIFLIILLPIFWDSQNISCIKT